MKPRQPTDEFGKVPSPGRPSCTIRELPFGDPLPSTDGRPVSRSRGAPQPPGDDPWRSRSLPAPTTRPGARPRHALSQLRRDPADRAVVRLSGLLRAARGRRTTTRSPARRSPARRSRLARPGSGATSSCCPSTRHRRAALPVGSTPLLAADRLAPSLGLDRLLDQGRHPQSVAVVQGSGGRGGRRAGRRVRRRGARLRLDRQPGRGDRRRRGRRRAAGLRLHPGRPRAGQGRPRARLRRDGRADRRAPTTTSTGCASRSPTRPAGASSTSTCGRSTPKAPRRSPTRSPSRSAGGRPTSSSARSHRARCSPASRAASRSSRARAHRAPADPLRRRPGGGLRAGRDRVGGRDRRHRAGPDARTRSSARSPSATRPTAATWSSWCNETGGSVEAIDDEVTAAAIRDVARLEGIYPETAGGVTLAAAAAARRRGVIRPGDEVVALLTGNGLKTPDARTLGHGGRRRPSRRAGPRPGRSGPACRRSSAGWAARHEHGPHPADAAGRDRRRQAGRGPAAARSARSWPGSSSLHPGLESQLIGTRRRPEPLRQRVPQRHRRPPPRGARHARRRGRHAGPAAGDGRRLAG